MKKLDFEENNVNEQELMVRDKEQQLVRKQDYVCSIPSKEFEKYCLRFLRDYAETEKLQQFGIKHNKKSKTRDGKYQIDISASFWAVGIEFKIICECKQLSEAVSRDMVVALSDKVKSADAHKGILMSTSGFQNGAIQYAKQHSISLLQIFDKESEIGSFSTDRQEGSEANPSAAGKREENDDDPRANGYRIMPEYYVIEISDAFGNGKRVSPTPSYIDEVNKEIDKKIGASR